MGDLPRTYPTVDVDPVSVAESWLDAFQSSCDNANTEAFCNLFIPSGWFRDLVCFSWDFRTLSSVDKISAYLDEQCDVNGTKCSRFAKAGLHDVTLDSKSTLGPPHLFPIPGASNPEARGIIAYFRCSLKNPDRSGRGGVRLVPDVIGDQIHWRALTLMISVQGIKGYEEPISRPSGVWNNHTITWGEIRERRVKEIEDDPTVLIIGGGTAGLMCAARLGKLGVRALIVEKTKRFGDVWRDRYPNLTLHTPALHSSLVYHPFPKDYPQYLPKDILADFLEFYAHEQNIVGWLSTQVLSDPRPTYNADTGRWTVHVEKDIHNKAKVITINPRHVVVALGNGPANVPSFAGMDNFTGDVYHSNVHQGVSKYAGKRAIVVGAANAAADIAKSFLSETHPARSITMVQRSATCVVSQQTAEKVHFASCMQEDRDTEDDDFEQFTLPLRLLFDMQSKYGGTEMLKELDAQLHQGLRQKGFQLTWEYEPGGPEIGLAGRLYENFASGTMIDYGTGQAIIDGKIQIKSGAGIDHFEEKGIVLTDGTRLEADVVVLATGNLLPIENVTRLFGEDVSKAIGNKIWGLDPEGEFINSYRPIAVPGLWFAPGGIQHPRFLSRYLAIQILAEEKGLKV